MLLKKVGATEELVWTLAYDQLTEKKPEVKTEEQPEEIINYT